MILNSIEQGEGPPLILLHGLFGTAKNLGAVARGLSAQARVISMDLRNHGDSPHAPDMAYTTMAADIAETMNAKGIKAAPVVGHSMGGKVAMTLALTQPERIEKLVVMDIAPITYDHDYEGYVEAMQAIPLNNEVNRKAANAFLEAKIPDAALRVFLLSNLVLGDNPHWRFGLSEIGGAMHTLLQWTDPVRMDPVAEKPFKNPVLFLRGSDSDYILPESYARIEAVFPGAKIQTIENAAHWIHAHQPQAVIAALQKFLF
jgi:pimeloyl-ACP methyl ester carboxylesterase